VNKRWKKNVGGAMSLEPRVNLNLRRLNTNLRNKLQVLAVMIQKSKE
jgi:hypothetical protein